MMQSVLESNEGKRLVRAHGVLSDFRDKGDIFKSRKTRNQVVELEDEADVLPAIGRKFSVSQSDQITIPKKEMTARRVIETTYDIEKC
jgi:hypothetical protein